MKTKYLEDYLNRIKYLIDICEQKQNDSETKLFDEFYENIDKDYGLQIK